ncbi:hypothetical protein HK104_002978, partial [Borealophlyctis nickersoniae]
CAIRETIDITGLSAKDIQFEDDFCAEIKYLSGSRPKRVVYYLAQLSQNARIIPGGLAGLHITWLALQPACEKVVYKSMQDVLKQAAAFLEEKRTKTLSSGLNLQRSDRNNGGDRMDKRPAKSSSNDELARTHQPGSPVAARQTANHSRSGEGRNAGTGFNSSRNWRSDRGEGAKAGWEDDMRNALPSTGTTRSSNNTSQADNPLYKTRLCERFETEGFCPYGNRCTFAHGTVELRLRPTFTGEAEKKDGPENPLYKTRLCERFMKEGFCQYGPRCNFAHSELRDRPHNPKEDEEISSRQDLPVSAPGKSRSASPHTKTVQPEMRGEPPREHLPREHLPREHLWREHPPREPSAKAPSAASPVLPSVPAPAPSPVPSGSPIPAARARKDEKVSLQDLLSGKDTFDSLTRKSWMKVVDLSDDEKEKLKFPHKPPQQNGPSGHPDKQSLVVEKLIGELRQFFAGGTHSVNDQIKEVTRVEFRHDLSKQQLFNILLPAIFDESYSTAKLADKVKLFKAFLRSRQDQTSFLNSWEKHLGNTPHMMPKAALIFKDLYDKDLVEEEQFIQWNRKTTVNPELKKRCAPFIEWLQTAEEEEE